MINVTFEPVANAASLKITWGIDNINNYDVLPRCPLESPMVLFYGSKQDSEEEYRAAVPINNLIHLVVFPSPGDWVVKVLPYCLEEDSGFDIHKHNLFPKGADLSSWMTGFYKHKELVVFEQQLTVSADYFAIIPEWKKNMIKKVFPKRQPKDSCEYRWLLGISIFVYICVVFLLIIFWIPGFIVASLYALFWTLLLVPVTWDSHETNKISLRHVIGFHYSLEDICMHPQDGTAITPKTAFTSPLIAFPVMFGLVVLSIPWSTVVNNALLLSFGSLVSWIIGCTLIAWIVLRKPKKNGKC